MGRYDFALQANLDNTVNDRAPCSNRRLDRKLKQWLVHLLVQESCINDLSRVDEHDTFPSIELAYQ